MRGSKQVQQLARQLFKASIVDGQLSAERVAGVLEYIEKHAPAKSLAVLQAYRRLVATEVAKSRAVIEHAGPVGDGVLKSIEGAMVQRYRRPITAVTRPNPALLAGGCYEADGCVRGAAVFSPLSLARKWGMTYFPKRRREFITSAWVAGPAWKIGMISVAPISS